jgi:IS5 family transposase
MGDPLTRLNEVVNWEVFRPTLDEAFKKEPKGPGGRPSYDLILMFKILILQQIYALSDAKAQYMILDRLSFMRFLDLTLADAVPDEKTIWLFRQKLVDTGIIMDLFGAFRAVLAEKGLLMKEGSIIDASFAEAPRQRITRTQREALDAGNAPEEWEQNSSVQRQKDTDAAWTKKHGRAYYGYKNHVKVTCETKLIETFEVTPANVHDSQVVAILLDEETDAGMELYGDKAYDGAPVRRVLRRHRVKNRLLKRAAKNKPLSAHAEKENIERSKVRARVEHVFGAMKTSFGGQAIRCRGILRAFVAVGLKNLAYNMQRMEYLLRTG